jgi:hypothetical protein
MTLQGDGKILLAGQSYNSSGDLDFALVRYNSDGSEAWTRLVGGSGLDQINSLVIGSDG